MRACRSPICPCVTRLCWPFLQVDLRLPAPARWRGIVDPWPVGGLAADRMERDADASWPVRPSPDRIANHREPCRLTKHHAARCQARQDWQEQTQRLEWHSHVATWDTSPLTKHRARLAS